MTDQGKTTTVPNPANYTIIFNTDGTLNGKADCNTFNGVYSQQNGFTIKLGASTMAFCGEASLDVQYTQLLSNVAAGGPDGAGGLALGNGGRRAAHGVQERRRRAEVSDSFYACLEMKREGRLLHETAFALTRRFECCWRESRFIGVICLSSIWMPMTACGHDVRINNCFLTGFSPYWRNNGYDDHTFTDPTDHFA